MDAAKEKWNKYKPQLLDFFKVLKEELAKGTKTNDTKEVNLEIEGGKDAMNGISSQTYSLKPAEYTKIISTQKDYMTSALAMATVSINANSVEAVGLLEGLFNSMKPMIEEIPFVKEHVLTKGSYHLRIEGTKMSIDFVLKDGETLKGLVDLGINPADFHSLKIFLGTAFTLPDFFTLNLEQMLEKLFSLHFSIDQNLFNLTYLAKAVITALESVKIDDEKIQKRIKKALFYSKAASAFLSAKFALKYSPKEAVEFALKSPIIEEQGGKDGITEQLEQYKMMAEQMGKEMIKGTLEGMGMLEPAKAANVDNIIIGFVCPKYQTGIVQEFKFPGLTALFNEKFLS